MSDNSRCSSLCHGGDESFGNISGKAVNQIEQLTKEVQSGNDKLQRMMEQIIHSNNARFGRSSEKMDNTDQISFMEVDGNIILFKESEAVCELSCLLYTSSRFIKSILLM